MKEPPQQEQKQVEFASDLVPDVQFEAERRPRQAKRIRIRIPRSARPKPG